MLKLYQIHNIYNQGCIQGVCLVVTTGPFVPQVLSIKTSKILNAVTTDL